MDPISRRQFERQLRHRQFVRSWDDSLEKDRILWTKACYKGCRFLKVWMDPSIYDPEVLGLEFEKIEELDCSHTIPLPLESVPADDPTDLPDVFPTIDDDLIEDDEDDEGNGTEG